MKRPNNFRLIVSSQTRETLGPYASAVLWAVGLDNKSDGQVGAAYLRDAGDRIRSMFSEAPPSSHPHVAAMRSAFSRFGAKPSRYLCSVESLAKRAVKEDLPSISAVVDVYNSVSLDYLIPIGGEDWDRLASDLILKPAAGDEPFVTRSADGQNTEYPEPGELIWCDGLGTTCRRLNWRQCERTAIRSETKNAYFVLDGLSPYGVREVRRAADELERRLHIVCPAAEMEIEVISSPAVGTGVSVTALAD